MKMSWGTRIVILIALFFVLMAVMVYISFNQRVDLVTKNYYEKELQFQNDIDKKQNTLALSQQVDIEQSLGKIAIHFPVQEVGTGIKGDIHLYRASDARIDKVFPVQVDSAGNAAVPLTNIRPGSWKVIVNWRAHGKDYISEKILMIE